jgi:peptide/nickel transport system ATP-binding protein
MNAPAVAVDGLRVELAGDAHDDIVDEISFAIAPGEVVGLVGESGSGKTTVAMALLGYARSGARIARGSVRVGDVDVLSLGVAEQRALRGRLVAYVPQDPSSALNPALRIGTQLQELLEIHAPGADREARRERVRETLAEAGLPPDDELLRRFPHQLSGGQQQRIFLAMAFLLRPRLIVLDEPTTGLDVTTQAHVLRTVAELCRAHGAAALYVTHDLAVVANIADRVMVMYAGRMAEMGSRDALFARPAHPYTARLLAAVPDVAERRALEPIAGLAPAPGARPGGCEFADRCPACLDLCRSRRPPLVTLDDDHVARCHRAAERLTIVHERELGETRAEHGEAVLEVRSVSAVYGARQVLHDVSLRLGARECLALVGESGSGKTTLARVLIGLLDHGGEVLLDGERLPSDARRRSAQARRELQYVFQNPYASLNPRKTIAEIVATPLRHLFDLERTASRRRVEAAIARVALPAQTLGRYPDQLSGGERQRVAIARALVCEPRVLICDEVTSALDVSVQAAIVEVLRELRESEGLSLLFVTHNLALVRSIADRVAVMHEGRIVELGATDAVLDAPTAPYSRRLLADTPTLAGGPATRTTFDQEAAQ